MFGSVAAIACASPRRGRPTRNARRPSRSTGSTSQRSPGPTPPSPWSTTGRCSARSPSRCPRATRSTPSRSKLVHRPRGARELVLRDERLTSSAEGGARGAEGGAEAARLGPRPRAPQGSEREHPRRRPAAARGAAGPPEGAARAPTRGPRPGQGSKKCSHELRSGHSDRARGPARPRTRRPPSRSPTRSQTRSSRSSRGAGHDGDHRSGTESAASPPGCRGRRILFLTPSRRCRTPRSTPRRHTVTVFGWNA